MESFSSLHLYIACFIYGLHITPSAGSASNSPLGTKTRCVVTDMPKKFNSWIIIELYFRRQNEELTATWATHTSSSASSSEQLSSTSGLSSLPKNSAIARSRPRLATHSETLTLCWKTTPRLSSTTWDTWLLHRSYLTRLVHHNNDLFIYFGHLIR